MAENSESQRGLPSFIGSFFNTSGYNEYINKPQPLPQKTFDSGFVVVNPSTSLPPYSNNYNTTSTLPPNFTQMDSSSPIPPSFQENQTSVIPPYGNYQSVLPPSFNVSGWEAPSGWNPVESPSQSWNLNTPSIQTTPPSEYVKFSLSTLTPTTSSTAPSAPSSDFSNHAPTNPTTQLPSATQQVPTVQPVQLTQTTQPIQPTQFVQPIQPVQPVQTSTSTPSSGLNIPPPVVNSAPLSPLSQLDLPPPPPVDAPVASTSTPVDASIPAPPPPPPTTLKSASTLKLTKAKPVPVKSFSHEDMLLELQNGRSKLKKSDSSGIVRSNSDDLISTLSSALDARFAKIRKSQEEEDEVPDEEFVDKSIGKLPSSPAIFRSN